VIEEGLQPDNRVVVNGIQRARPGAKVDPEQTDMNTLSASALKAAAEAGQDKTKPAAAPSEGGDSQPDKEAEKKE
jgi:membrane fusion protein (multidrug efflux system)